MRPSFLLYLLFDLIHLRSLRFFYETNPIPANQQHEALPTVADVTDGEGGRLTSSRPSPLEAPLTRETG